MSSKKKRTIIKRKYKQVFKKENTGVRGFVIKSITPEHGAQIIKWFQDQGVYTGGPTGKFNASFCERDGNTLIYYGLLRNDDFDHYTYEDVIKFKGKIIELPLDYLITFKL